MTNTFTAPDGKTRPRPMLTYRFMTLAEVKQLSGHANFLANDGTIRRVKVTSVKVWKTRPGDVLVGVKYGMYEYASLGTAEALARFVHII